MIALGMLLMVIGFAIIVTRGGVAGSTAARHVILGPQLFKSLGYQDNSSVRYRIVRALIGLTFLAGGVALIAVST
jgi:hypothetical protein